MGGLFTGSSLADLKIQIGFVDFVKVFLAITGPFPNFWQSRQRAGEVFSGCLSTRALTLI
jgi:hypothetical protein